MAEDELALKLERVVSNPGEAPRVAHKFSYARVGSQVVLEVGHFDLAEIHSAASTKPRKPGAPVQTKFYVSARFALSPESVLDLLNVSEQMVRDLRKSKVLPEETTR